MTAYVAMTLLGAFVGYQRAGSAGGAIAGGLVGLAIATTIGMVVGVALTRAGSPLWDGRPEQ